MNDLAQIQLFENALPHLWRLDKYKSTGLVKASFIFVRGKLDLNYDLIEKYSELTEVKTEMYSTALIVHFKDKEVSQYFWDNWKCDYKFEIDD